jgi:hypothetical protein
MNILRVAGAILGDRDLWQIPAKRLADAPFKRYRRSTAFYADLVITQCAISGAKGPWILVREQPGNDISPPDERLSGRKNDVDLD